MIRITEIIKTLEFSSKKASPFTSDQIFKAFKQGTVDLPLLRKLGGGGNCASVALIKAAIGTFGFNNVFKSIIIDEVNNRYIIDLKDDDKSLYSLSFENYKIGAIKSAFETEEHDETSLNIFEFAKFCFAVMAEVKRWDYRFNNSYQRAIIDLNKGEYADYIHEYLGLTAVEVANLSIANLSQQKNMVLWNGPHAVYSSEGYYDEFFSELNHVPLDGKQPIEMLKEVHGDGSEKYAPVGANTFI